MRLLVWIVRLAVFFALFAFALNNQDVVTLHWFFDYKWRAPMVFIVLAAFALGCAFGIFAMVPAWWRHRRVARRKTTVGASEAPASPVEPAPIVHPPRDGL
jgi:uncharacterized integral membrane protein